MLNQQHTVVDPASSDTRAVAEAAPVRHTIRDLIHSRASVAPQVTLNALVDYFSEHPDRESIAIIDTGNIFLGLVQKGQLMAQVGSKYGYALYERRPVTLLIDPESLALPGETAIGQAIQRVVSRTTQRVYDDIAVVGAARQFEGIVSVKNLILHQSSEIREQLAIIQRKDELINDVLLKNQELAVASRLKTEFLTNMSHELRTPLVSIIGFTDLVRTQTEGMVPEIQTRNLERVISSGRDLLDLINNLLDLSKIEAGRMSAEAESFVLNDLVQELLERVAVIAADRQLGLVSAIPAGFEIDSDRAKLRQILLNLLSNAVKFTERGSVSISAEERGPLAEISVTDTGIGIRPEDLPRLLQRFEQLDSGKTKQYQGTGLGLAISRELAQLLGGDISVRSEYGRGSTFTVTVARRLNPAISDRPRGLYQN